MDFLAKLGGRVQLSARNVKARSHAFIRNLRKHMTPSTCACKRVPSKTKLNDDAANSTLQTNMKDKRALSLPELPMRGLDRPRVPGHLEHASLV